MEFGVDITMTWMSEFAKTSSRVVTTLTPVEPYFSRATDFSGVADRSRIVCFKRQEHTSAPKSQFYPFDFEE